MDLTYFNAHATIVALSGTNADCGLTGVSQTSRTQQSEEFIDSKQFLTVLPDWFNELTTSTYNTRAWTMQEMMLSGRRILIGAGQVYYVCNSAVYWESIDDSSDPARYLDSLAIPLPDWSTGYGVPLVCLCLSVDIYTSQMRYAPSHSDCKRRMKNIAFSWNHIPRER